MMLLAVVAAILASLVLGVAISYGLCFALLAVFRLHARASRPPTPAPLQTHTARS